MTIKNNKKSKKSIKKNLKRKVIKRVKSNQDKLIEKSTQQNTLNNNNLNSIRNQLLARGLVGTLGFSPQQYGNLNNERRIQDLKNSSQNYNQEINNYKATIESLEKEKTEKEDETKKLKKLIKKQKKKLNDASYEKDKVKLDLEEAKRGENQTSLLQKETRNLLQQQQEIITKNQITVYKTKLNDLEAKNHQLKIDGEELERRLTENTLYHELEKLKNEVTLRTSQNNAKRDILESDSFKNTNKEYEDLYKKDCEEQYKAELQNELIKKNQELNQLRLKIHSAADPKELEAITNQVAARISQVENTKLQLENNLEQAKIPLGVYNHMNELELKAQEGLLDTKLEQAKTNAKLNLVNSEKQNTIENLESEESELGQKAGELEAKEEAINENRKAIIEARKARFNKSKAQSRLDFLNSPVAKQYIDVLAETKTQTQKNQDETDQLNLLAQNQEEANKAELSKKIAQNTVDQGYSETQQANYLIDNFEKLNKDIQERERLATTMNELTKTNPQAWVIFLRSFPTTLNLAGTNYKNASLEQLRSLVNAFESFANSYNKPISPEIISNNNNNNNNNNIDDNDNFNF